MRFPILLLILLLGCFLSIPLFFLWYRLFKKYIINTKRRKLLTFLQRYSRYHLSILDQSLSGFLLSAIIQIIVSIKKWSTNQETRYELSKDIIGSRMLIGKTKLEVLKILGDENNKIEENHWIYYLGTRPELFNIDPDMLKIEFIDGKVIKVSQHPT